MTAHRLVPLVFVITILLSNLMMADFTFCDYDKKIDTVLSCRTRFAYIANQIGLGKDPNTISICPANNNGSLNACTVATDPTFSRPIDIVTNHLATVAYVLNASLSSLAGNHISQCLLGIDGSLNSCSIVYTPISNDFVRGGLFPTDRYLYITQAAGSVLVCQLNNDGTFAGTCVVTVGNLSSPHGRIAISPDGSTAYIADQGSSSVSICSVNPDGTFGTCSSTVGNGTITDPLGAALSWTGKTLYVPNLTNNSVAICPVNGDGSLGICSTSTGNGTFDFSDNMEINLFIGNRRTAYIPNPPSNTVSICPINVDGTFGTCVVDADSTFDDPSSTWLTFSK